MLLKRYEKAGCSAVWSNSKNHSDHLACTSVNALNPNLNDLQLLSIDFGDRSKNLNLAGKAMYNVPFRSLAWGTFGQRQQTLPYGLIFGGMENGSFTLWNPAEMIDQLQDVNENSIEQQKSFIYAQQPDEDGYPILCAQWNNLKNNFLAFGSTNLLLLDVGKDVSNPDILKPSQHNPHEGSYISSVSWNKQVPHVLASAGSDGLIALWDIKQSRSIFQFKDSAPSSAYRQVQITWSKHISTQIAVTLDDDKKNQLQIWDLRNQKGPIVVIDKIHTKGINSIDWSDTDHDLILASSRDRKMVCWNYKNDEAPLAVKQLSSDINKVAWSHTLSSIYSVTTNDGIQIYSMDDKNLLSYVPKWLKVPTGTTFNGNDSLLNYSDQRANIIQEFTIQTNIKSSISEKIAQLEHYLQHRSLDGFKLPAEQQTFWKLIATKKSQDGDSDIYNFLGLNKQKIIKEVQKYTGKKRQSFSENFSKKKNKVSKADYIPVSGVEAASFFGSLGSSVANKMTQNQDDNEQQNIKYDMVPRNFNWNMGKQRLIKQNMLIGNYQGAIDAALKCGRTAQALIIAYSLDQNTFNNTLKTFFTETTDHFISDILKHIAFKDTQELVLKYDLKKWRQCVALIYSISSSDKRKNLLKLLGQRICEQDEKDQQLEQAGIYCFILADEFQFVADQFIHRLSTVRDDLSARKLAVVHYATKLLGVLDSLTINPPVSLSFEKLLKQAAIVCLQAGKKIASFKIFRTYLSNTSFRFIDYLVNNTQELVQQRNNSLNVLSLPIMTRKSQQKQQQSTQQKKTKAKKIINQQLPTNIRPQINNPGMQQQPQFENSEVNKRAPISYQEAARNRNNPPPAPQKRMGPQIVHSFNPDQSQPDHGQVNPPPTSALTVKKNNPPPPPKMQNKAPYEQSTGQHRVPPPPNVAAKRSPPPPPSMHHQDTDTSRSSIPPPPAKTMRQPPPPPKKQIHQMATMERQEQGNFYESQQPSRTPPPPVNHHKPPPPPPSKPVTIAPSRPVGGQVKSVPPPMAYSKPTPQLRMQQGRPVQNDYQEQEQDEEQQEYSQQPPPPSHQVHQAPNRIFPPKNIQNPAKNIQNPSYTQQQQPQTTYAQNPTPKNSQNPTTNTNVGKKGPPPPPTRMQKQETENSQQSESFYEQQPRQDTNKPSRRVPPPPGRR